MRIIFLVFLVASTTTAAKLTALTKQNASSSIGNKSATRRLCKEVGNRLMLKSGHGSYLQASPDVWTEMVFMAPHKTSWADWYMDEQGGNVVLRALHNDNRFLCANKNGSVTLNEHVDGWEAWTPYKNVDGSWSFRGANGKWLSANSDGVVSTRGSYGKTEHFWLEQWSTDDIKKASKMLADIGTHLALRSKWASGDTYLRHWNDYPVKRQIDMAACNSKWTKWNIEDMTGQVRLTPASGSARYLEALSDGTFDLSRWADNWRWWTPYKNSDGSWSFLSYRGMWLSAFDQGTVRTAIRCGATEHFWIEKWCEGRDCKA